SRMPAPETLPARRAAAAGGVMMQGGLCPHKRQGGRGWSEAKPRRVTRLGQLAKPDFTVAIAETRAGASRWSSPGHPKPGGLEGPFMRTPLSGCKPDVQSLAKVALRGSVQ